MPSLKGFQEWLAQGLTFILGCVCVSCSLSVSSFEGAGGVRHGVHPTPGLGGNGDERFDLVGVCLVLCVACLVPGEMSLGLGDLPVGSRAN